jgi:hypothetical protein
VRSYKLLDSVIRIFNYVQAAQTIPSKTMSSINHPAQHAYTVQASREKERIKFQDMVTNLPKLKSNPHAPDVKAQMSEMFSDASKTTQTDRNKSPNMYPPYFF